MTTLWRFASIPVFHFLQNIFVGGFVNLFYLFYTFYPSSSSCFAGLWGLWGGSDPVLEPCWDLRQEGPGGDGAHCGIGPSSSGPIFSTWWPFWSWGWVNRIFNFWLNDCHSMLTDTQVQWLGQQFESHPKMCIASEEWNDKDVLCTSADSSENKIYSQMKACPGATPPCLIPDPCWPLDWHFLW